MKATELLKSAFSGLGQKGQSMNEVIYACISIVIGLVVVMGVLATVDQSGFSAAANTTYASVQTGIFSAFSLSTVIPIVIIAGLIFLYLRAR